MGNCKYTTPPTVGCYPIAQLDQLTAWALPCSRSLLPTRCWFVWRWCVSALDQRSWRRCLGGLKNQTSKEKPDSTLRVQFWTPMQRKRVKKGVRKWSPLKVPPPGGSSFGPFIVANLLKLIWSATGATGILNWGSSIFARLLFLTFWGPKKKSAFFVILFCSNFQALRPSTPASKPAPRCFSMVSRHWSSRFALRPASNFVSSYKLFVLLQFP